MVKKKAKVRRSRRVVTTRRAKSCPCCGRSY